MRPDRLQRTPPRSRSTELQRLHLELEAAAALPRPDRELFLQCNERFHLRLLAIANNRWAMQMVADLRKVMKLNRRNSLLKTGRIAESLAEHRAIMQAVAAHDWAAASSGMLQHFRNGLEAAA